MRRSSFYDHQDAERGDARGDAREPHQDEAGKQRQYRRDATADQHGRHQRQRQVLKEGWQVGQHRRLGRRRYRDDAGGVSADAHERHRCERHHPGVADKGLQADDQYRVDAETQQEVGLGPAGEPEVREDRYTHRRGERHVAEDDTRERAAMEPAVDHPTQHHHFDTSTIRPAIPDGRTNSTAITSPNAIACW